MPQKYYLDAAIYIDYYNNRRDRFRPLGDWAHRLLALIETKGDVLIVSDFLIAELESHLSKREVKDILSTYKGIIRKIEFTDKQFKEAKELANKRRVPLGDVLHSIIARDNDAILVTRDHHFEGLNDISVPHKPEDVI